MRQARGALSTVWLIAALLLAAIFACTDEAPSPVDAGLDANTQRSPAKWGRGVYVEQAWRVARAVNGHRVHVIRRRIACASCHSITETELGTVEFARCGSCHEHEAHIEHASAQAAARFGAGTKADCTTCHAFTLPATEHARALEKLDQPRPPPSALAAGGAAPERTSRERALESFAPGDCKRCHATAQGKLSAVQAHGTQNCLSCHRPHEDRSPQAAPCNGCHTDITTRHGAAHQTIIETCSTCHRHQHAAAAVARKTCAECHARTEPIVPATALFAGGHEECVGCHRPHEFSAGTAACRTCHEHQTLLGGGRIPAHNQCTSCHAPHDVKGSPEAACAKCHAAVHPDHPSAHPGAAPCRSCHDPHPNARAAATERSGPAPSSAASCSSCHQFASTDHGSHLGVACTQCHTPHRFVLDLAERALCATCHTERVAEVATNPGHQACQSCHRGLPHQPEAPRAECASCHANQHARVNPGHTTCTNCHEPHSGAQAQPCGTCHRNEHATAPEGHRACTNCHEPHAGTRTRNTCDSCHRKEAESPHGQLAAGCSSCHRAHGPAGVARPPACATCHQPATLPGLHAEANHQPCARCHTGHGDAEGLARSVCLSCHRDREQHFPNAPRCANCHLFAAR